jgi:hypothetical protein
MEGRQAPSRGCVSAIPAAGAEPGSVPVRCHCHGQQFEEIVREEWPSLNLREGGGGRSSLLLGRLRRDTTRIMTRISVLGGPDPCHVVMS